MTDMNNNKPRGNGGENRDRKPSFGGNGERKFGNKGNIGICPLAYYHLFSSA